MDDLERDREIRLAAFSFLDQQTGVLGDVLPRQLLAAGFQYRGDQIRLIGPQGIFRPAALPRPVPLSITSVPIVEGRSRPYEDEVTDDGLIRYRYRGTDPNHVDNVGLREAMRRQAPLVYLHGVMPGHYRPMWPVFVVDDNPSELSFTVAVDDPQVLRTDLPEVVVDEARRRYVTRLARQRLHQVAFRHRVIAAYRESCAVCRLRHPELLDAAHILPDGHPRGEPVVPNGLAMCKLHHAAFDRNIIGVRPDLTVEIRPDVLEEVDGPMLLHGLQDFQGGKLLVVPRAPTHRPNPEFLAERYEEFRAAG